MKRVLHLAGVLAVLLAAIVLGALPPVASLADWIDARAATLLLAAAGVTALGLALLLGGVLKRAMGEDVALSHADAEDVARRVNIAATPVTTRTSGYRVFGEAAGRRGAESFSVRALKDAWRKGALWRDSEWRRRAATMAGGLLLFVGICVVFVVVGAPWIKVLMAAVALYALARIALALWRA